MSAINLRHLIATSIARVHLNTYLTEELTQIKDWTPMVLIFDALQEKAGPIGNHVQVLRKYKEFKNHADLERVLEILRGGYEDNEKQGIDDSPFDTLWSIIDQFVAAEMKLPKWVPRSDVELVRVLNHISGQNFVDIDCHTCYNILLHEKHPEFEADLATYETFANFQSYKKRKICTSCEAAGESAMERHDPTILVCGRCGIPAVSVEKVDEANAFCDLLRQKYNYQPIHSSS